MKKSIVYFVFRLTFMNTFRSIRQISCKATFKKCSSVFIPIDM